MDSQNLARQEFQTKRQGKKDKRQMPCSQGGKIPGLATAT